VRRFAKLFATAACALLAGVAGEACSSTPSTQPHRSVASLGGSRGGATTSSLGPRQTDRSLLEYTRCLRAHGLDEPDPYHPAGHHGYTIVVPRRTTSDAHALDACASILPPVLGSKFAGAEAELARWLPGLTDYAACMRGHDIAMLDPSPLPSRSGLVSLGRVAGIDNNFGRFSPQFHAADVACRHLLPHGVRDDGSGP